MVLKMKIILDLTSLVDHIKQEAEHMMPQFLYISLIGNILGFIESLCIYRIQYEISPDSLNAQKKGIFTS